MNIGNKIANQENAKKNITLHRSEYANLYKTHSRQVVYLFQPGKMLDIPDIEAEFFLKKYDFLYSDKPVKEPVKEPVIEPKPVIEKEPEPIYEDMKINELRTIASQNGLSGKGGKDELIRRINAN